MRSTICLPFILFFTAFQVAFAQSKEVKFAAADVKTDLAYLYNTLQEAHYNLYAYVGKNKYDKAYGKMLKSVKKDSVSLLETTKLFQKLAATGNAGHCEVDFAVQPYIAFAQDGGKVFPLELAFENGKAYVRKSYTSNTAIAPGDQVQSINGKAIGQIQEAIHPYLSAERVYFKNAKLEFWSFPRLYWSTFGAQDTFIVKVKKATGKTESYTLEAIPVMTYETERGGEILSAAPTFSYYDDVAYLNPGPFSSSTTDGEQQFKTYIDSVFADIHQKKANTLILDLRNHAGGHNAYSDHLISYFADKPFRWFSSFQIKTSKILKEHTLKNAPDTTDAYTKAILSHQNDEQFAYDHPRQNPVPAARRFNGKVYVLVNRQTYSMAAVSAALIQDYGFAELVGEETGDVPTLYASQFSFPLPKTGIIAKVPKGYIVRPNGNTKLAGVKPDYVVTDHLLAGEDEILNYTLYRLLNKKMPEQAAVK